MINNIINKIKNIFLITALTIVSCSRVVVNYKNNTTMENMEKINVIKLFDLKNSETEKVKIWNDSKNIKFIEYVKEDKVNDTKTYINGNSTEGFRKGFMYIDFYFGKKCMMEDLSIFNPSGNLIKKSKFCWSFVISDISNLKIDDLAHETSFITEVGIWSEYDDNGNVIKKIDYDKDFKFNLSDVINYLKSLNLNFRDNNLSRFITISKDVTHNCWRINHPINDSNVRNTVTKYLDGKTGAIISENKVVMYNR